MSTTLPWRIGIPADVITEYAGTKLRDFYLQPEVMLESQLKAFEIFEKEYDLHRTPSIQMTSYLPATTLGLSLHFPEDAEPQYDNDRPLKSVDEIDTFGLPDDLSRCGLMPRYIEALSYFRSRLGEGYPLYSSGEYSAGFQGPFTTAVLLRGEELFADVYTAPEKVELLLELITQNHLRLAELFRRLNGGGDLPVTGAGITDDYGGLVSPDHYGRFVAPYLKRLYDAYPDAARSLHAETLHPEHIEYLSRLEISSYDPGMNQYLSIEDILERTDTFFYWNLFTSRDMLLGTPDSIRKLVVESVEKGAPGIMTEICRATPPENVRAFLSCVRSM